MSQTEHLEEEEKMNAPAKFEQPNALRAMADRYGMDPVNYQDVILKTVMPESATPAHFRAFIAVANTYNLNPLTQEIYAFRTRSGGIQPIVGVNGWVTLINRQPQFDGMEFEYEWRD